MSTRTIRDDNARKEERGKRKEGDYDYDENHDHERKKKFYRLS